MNEHNYLTVIMYHYVRELSDSRFPAIKGLSVEKFKYQLDYLEQYYTFVRMEDCLESLETGRSLPQNALLLTFDDGYLDHFLHVFPILSKRNIQGSFFPPAKVILENCVLDVNKIHFILASAEDKSSLLKVICERIDYYKNTYNLEKAQDYVSRIHTESRYDSQEVVLIKCLLQRDLPFEARTQITNDLFKKYIQVDERVFSKELYINTNQIKMMKHYGMFIGSHSYDHVWMDTLLPDQQLHEVNRSIEFMRALDIDTNNWVMCYPYGAYNKKLIDILKQKNCRLGLTTHVDVARLKPENAFIIPRLDTNDFPTISKAAMNHWTSKVSMNGEFERV